MYEKQNFVKGQILKAEDLNKIEDGIIELSPIVSTTDIAAGSASGDGRPYHVIE